MRAVVVSDLHLGTVTGRDLVRRPGPRAALMERVAGADHVVLLGDALELREARLARVLTLAEPFFRELGQAAGGARITIVPGNHDHRLSWPLTDGRSGPLPVDAAVPAPSTGPFELIARALGKEADLAYPGVWLRPDVYATHGHYLDCHLELPTFERLAIAVSARAVYSDGIRSAADHEAVVGPVYALAYSLAQSSRRARPVIGAGRSTSAWELLAGSDGRRGVGARLMAGVLLPATVGVINRTGLGPMTADLSGPSLRRTGLRAMATVAERLGVDSAHVLFGHTHRSGPWPRDDTREWDLPGGGRLLNTGSWIHEPAFVRAGRESPYWPGTVAIVEDDGPPRLERVLDDLPPTGT
ncbi:MAG TPA: metallophosphoesterase [Thermoleophilaceae bacterium]|nr:metallophosphoesterase [Thermoleophilaceae bacterium]